MQRGSIIQWGNQWRLKYRETVTVNGRKVRKDVYKNLAPVGGQYSTKNSVQPLADVILAPLNAGMKEARSVDSFDSFLETFIEKGEGGRGRMLRKSTKAGYKTIFNLLRPLLPNIELRHVRTSDIDRLMRKVAENDGEERRAQTTYQNVKNFLSSAFRYAVRYGLVDSNPVRDTAIPQGVDSDTHAYSLEEIYALMGAVDNRVAKAAIMVMTFTGLRGEEVKGLKWEDYADGVFHVRRGVVQGQVVETKTKASKAAVPVVKIVQDVLADHLKHNTGDGYIFHGETGEPLVLENMARRVIVPMLEQVGLTWYGFHACRRGLATVLHDLDIGELTIKHILRHSTNDVTSKHYIKPSLERSRIALEAVEKRYKAIKRR